MRHRIIIYGGELPPKVNPGRREVCPGDTVSWEARDTKVEIAFPPSRWPFVEPWEVIEVAKERVERAPKRSTYTVKGIGVPEDLDPFPYAVYCLSRNCFAVGASDPIIIIRRPS